MSISPLFYWALKIDNKNFTSIILKWVLGELT
jgi:hypothetical protein